MQSAQSQRSYRKIEDCEQSKEFSTNLFSGAVTLC